MDSLATGVNTSDGSFKVHWPAEIPSDMNEYQLVFLNFSNDSIISHSDSFILVGEMQPANTTQKNGGGLSGGDKAAIGVLVSLTVLAIVALCYYIHRLLARPKVTQNVLEKGDRPTSEAELEGSHFFPRSLHRRRPKLFGTDDVLKETDRTLIELPDGTLNEMPAVNRFPVEIASPTPPLEERCPQEAASPAEMPLPDPHTTTGGVSTPCPLLTKSH